jgi:hypothetical protein
MNQLFTLPLHVQRQQTSLLVTHTPYRCCCGLKEDPSLKLTSHLHLAYRLRISSTSLALCRSDTTRTRRALDWSTRLREELQCVPLWNYCTVERTLRVFLIYGKWNVKTANIDSIYRVKVTACSTREHIGWSMVATDAKLRARVEKFAVGAQIIWHKSERDG